jgi:hypothetical protein
MQVDHGRFQARMPEERLYDTDVVASLQKVGSIGMPKRVEQVGTGGVRLANL